MKLFVVGSDSPNPDNWGKIDYAIVVADDEEGALKLANFEGDFPVCEIPVEKAGVLLRAWT